jgi:proline iminopeptidase
MTKPNCDTTPPAPDRRWCASLAAGARMCATSATSVSSTKNRTLVLMDARAAGRSDAPADKASCAFTEQTRDVDALREQLGLDRIDLLAHSADCLTGQEFAAIKASRAHEPWYTTDQSSVDEDATVPFFYGKWSPAARQHHATNYARLAAVPNRVLAVAGELDGMIGTKPAQLAAATYPAAQLEMMSACGHWPWIDQPGHFVALVNDSLGQEKLHPVGIEELAKSGGVRRFRGAGLECSRGCETAAWRRGRADRRRSAWCACERPGWWVCSMFFWWVMRRARGVGGPGPRPLRWRHWLGFLSGRPVGPGGFARLVPGRMCGTSRGSCPKSIGEVTAPPGLSGADVWPRAGTLMSARWPLLLDCCAGRASWFGL